MPELNYGTHRRFHPLFHFVIIPILALNIVVAIRGAIHAESAAAWWSVVVAAAICATAVLCRLYALKNQDRLIRIEEQVRLRQLLPADLLPRVGELSYGQLIALRFCPDADLPELTRRVLNGELTSREQIKKALRSWRPDNSRI